MTTTAVEPTEIEPEFAPSAPAVKNVSKRWLTKDELVELMRIKPALWIRDLIVTWAVTLGALELAIVAGQRLPLWAGVSVYVGAFVLIGCMQNAFIQWRHEASHYSLSRDHRLNDLLADLFIAGPVGTTVGHYRYHHIPHHTHLNDYDREVQTAQWICVRGAHLFKELLSQLSGWWYASNVTRMLAQTKAAPARAQAETPKFTPAAVGSFLVFNAALFAACWAQGAWWAYFILWAVPPATVAQTLNNFRTILEHQPSAEVCDRPAGKMQPLTRVIRAGALERWLVAPVGFFHHHEHHTWPSIPYHRLGETRRLLQKKGYFDQEEIVYAHGYLRSLWRLAFQPGWGVRILNPFANLEELEREAHAAK